MTPLAYVACGLLTSLALLGVGATVGWVARGLWLEGK